MKRIYLLPIVSIVVFLSSATWSAENYHFDSNHTSVTWHVSHFGFSEITGKFMAEGTLSIDSAMPKNSSTNVIIHTDNMNTGITKLDDILKGKNFFNVSEFPTATFKSTKVVVTGKNTAKVYGTLTLRGIVKDVVMEVTLNKQGMHPYYNKPALGFSATTTLKRSDFNMSGYLPGISDNTEIDIEAEAILDAN